MNLSKISVARRVTATMLTLVLILFGALSFYRLGLDMMPDMEIPIIAVSTAYSGAAAEDIEQLITRPIEEIVSSIKGIDKVTSESSEGLSTVTVQFDWGADLDVAGQDIREGISRIRSYLPQDLTSEPMVMKFDMSMMPVMMSGVTGMNSTMELRKYLEDAIKPRLERLEGVGSVNVVGGPEREINVFLNKTRLDQYKIGPDAIMGALAASNMNMSSGYVSAGHQEYLVRTMGEFTDVNQIGNTIITTINGSPIRVNDVARVVDTVKERRSIMRLNKNDGVMVMITKQSGSNTLSTVNGIKAELEDLKSSMPPDLEFHPVFDQGQMVQRVVNNTTESAVTGGLLAVFILWLFLKNWRPTFIITLAIPISILTTFIGMYALGYTLNVITIGGLALAIGMLVDNAVVVIENIYRHLENGAHRTKAAVVGATEVGLAIGASTLTTVAVFVPLALAGGMAGIMARPLALTVSAGLGASLFVAVTIVPMLASVIFKNKESKKTIENEVHGGKLMRNVAGGYQKALGWALGHRLLVVLVTGGMFALAIVGLIRVGGEFMAESDSGMASVAINLPTGTNLDEADRLIRTIEDKFETIPEMETYGAMVGRISESGGGGGNSDVNEATLYYRLKEFKDRNRSTKEVTNELRESIPELHDVMVEFKSMGMSGGSDYPIELKFFGTDLEALKKYAGEAKSKMEKMEGLHDVNVSMREGKPELRLIPDRDKSSMMGLTVSEIGSGLRYANLGQVVTRYREAGDEYDIRIRLDEDDRSTIDKVTAIPLVTRSGGVTAAGNLGEIDYERGPVSITRENRVRVVSVTSQIKGRDVQGEVAKVKAELKELEASMPFGYFIEYGGSYEDMNKTFSDLVLALAIALILIYMIMAAQFESFIQPFIVMFTVPLAFIGVSLGLNVMRQPLSVTGFIGIIVLVGIVVNNGIVLITYINQLRGEGLNMREATIQAAGIRLRPILITSFTTIFGMLPMAFSSGQGSEMQAPMGTTVAFGLAVSTFLTLFVVPVFYSTVDGISHHITGFFKKRVLGETHVAKQ